MDQTRSVQSSICTAGYSVFFGLRWMVFSLSLFLSRLVELCLCVGDFVRVFYSCNY